MTDEPDIPSKIILKRDPGLRANFRYVFVAIIGSVIMGVTLPVLLVCWHESKDVHSRVTSLIDLEFVATIFCGPGATVLSALLFKFLSIRKEEHTVGNLVITGSLGGAAISFLNFPGLLVGAVLTGHGTMALVRIVLLFAVSGASCGAWTGWHVYRSTDPGAPFWPRYGLSTLLGLVFAWAVLLAIFAPSSQS